MTLPPQQPSVSPTPHLTSPQIPAPEARASQATPTAHVSVPASNAVSAAPSLNTQAQGDRFAAGARMGLPGEAPVSESPFEGGVAADPALVFSSPGYRFPPSPVNRPAQFSLWVAVVAVFFPFALVASIGAGIWGLIHAHMNYGVGRRHAAAALVISALSLLWWLFVWAAVRGLLPASL